MKTLIQTLIKTAIRQCVEHNTLATEIPSNIQINHCKNPDHGDFSSNIAMILAKSAQKAPRDVAALLIEQLKKCDTQQQITSIEIAGPGFINFRMSQTALFGIIETILTQKEQFGHSTVGNGEKVHLEFVSTNPTGPLHVGHGRGAAFGSCMATLLHITGHQVHREYYVNDAGRQMDILATSTWIRYLNLLGANIAFPSNGYKGAYIENVAQQLQQQYADQFKQTADKVLHNVPNDAEYNEAGDILSGDKEKHIDALIQNARKLLGNDHYAIIFQTVKDAILSDIRDDLSDFGVVFDEWFSEKQLMDNGAIQHCIDTLQKAGQLYQKDGALWFKTTDYGDDKDRVVIRANGQTTYFASDIAYHLNKIERGFDTITDVFGADHHGYIIRLKAAMAAMAGRSDALKIAMIQFVNLYRGKQKVSMSTRSASFITLRELRNEVGNDATRYFYLMRKLDQPLDFDMELAKSQSSENPVYYIQYAHARICSVWRQLSQKQLTWDSQQGLNHIALLTHPSESALATKLAQYPEMINKAAQQYEPHLLTYYLYECANQFHMFYNSTKFILDDDTLRNARLCLAKATQQVIANGLTLMGISAPDKM
jgi:arginyl-tRNA synthetase